MGVSKVTLNGDTLMDITSDTVDATNLLTGFTAHGADGESLMGSYQTPNSFGNITIGSATIQASQTADAFYLIQGDNIALTPNTVNKSITVGVNTTSQIQDNNNIPTAAAIKNYIDTYASYLTSITAMEITDTEDIYFGTIESMSAIDIGDTEDIIYG